MQKSVPQFWSRKAAAPHSKPGDALSGPDRRHGEISARVQVVVPKINLCKKKFFYDFKTGNYIISRVICKETLFLMKKFKNYEKSFLIMFFVIGFFLTIASYQFFENY